MGKKANGTSETEMVLYNISSTALVAGIHFITIPIFTRLLGTSGYGIVSIYVAWAQICTIFVGLKADGSIGSAHANLDDSEQDSYQWSILLLGFTSFILILILTLFFLDPLSALLKMPQLLVVSMVLQGFGSFVVALFSMRFIFKKEPKKNFLMSVGLSVVTTALSVVLIVSNIFGDADYIGYALGLSIPNFALGIGLMLSLARHNVEFKLRYWRFCISLTFPLIFHGLSHLVLAQTGKISIQQYLGNSSAGIYGIAVTVVSLLNAIYMALNNSFVPFMYDDLAGKTSEVVKQSHFRNYFLLFTLGTSAFTLMAPEILKLLSPEPYWDAMHYLPLLTFGQYCIFLYSFPVNYAFFRMKTRFIAVGSLGAAVLNVTLCVLLIPPLGIYGAAISTAVAYLALFVFHFSIAHFVLRNRHYPVRWFVAGLISICFLCLLCYPLLAAPIARWGIGVLFLSVALRRVIRTRSVF